MLREATSAAGKNWGMSTRFQVYNGSTARLLGWRFAQGVSRFPSIHDPTCSCPYRVPQLFVSPIMASYLITGVSRGLGVSGCLGSVFFSLLVFLVVVCCLG